MNDKCFYCGEPFDSKRPWTWRVSNVLDYTRKGIKISKNEKMHINCVRSDYMLEPLTEDQLKAAYKPEYCWWCGEEIPDVFNSTGYHWSYKNEFYYARMHNECDDMFKSVKRESESPMERFEKHGQIRGDYFSIESIIGQNYLRRKELREAWNEFLSAIKITQLWKWIDDKLNFIFSHRT